MDNLTSWYARNTATPAHNTKGNSTLPVGNMKQREMRGSYYGHQSHRNESSITNTHTVKTLERSNVNVNDHMHKSMGKIYSNPYMRSIQSSSTNRNQCAGAAPTNIVNCDRDLPMSQLTSSFDSSGNGSHFSQDDKRRQQVIQTELSGSSRGIPPFNTNRSTASTYPSTSTTNFSKIRDQPECKSLLSSMSQRTVPEGRLFRPNPGVSVRAQNLNQHSQESVQHVNNVAPLHSQNTSLSSGRSSHFISNDSFKAGTGIPQFQTKNRGLSQLSHSSSYSPTEEPSPIQNSHLQVILHDLQRRLSYLEDKNISCNEEADRKMKELVSEVKFKVDRTCAEYSEYTKSAAKCTAEMEQQAAELHADGLVIRSMYHKVAEMFKSIESSVESIHSMQHKVSEMFISIESSAENIKAITSDSISSIQQAHKSVVESVVPLLKQKASEIFTMLVTGWRFNTNPIEEPSPEKLLTESNLKIEEEQHKATLDQTGTTESCPCSKALSCTKGHSSSTKKASDSETIKDSSVEMFAQTVKRKNTSNVSLKPVNTTNAKYGENQNRTPASIVKKFPSESLEPKSKIEKTLKPLHITKVNVRSRNKISTEATSNDQAKRFKVMSGTHNPAQKTTPQPSKLVSPFASVQSKPSKTYTPTILVPSDFYPQSCVTPQRRTVSTNSAGKSRGKKVHSPSRKLRAPVKTVVVKRTRSRYGRARIPAEDDEMDYCFLSN